MLNFVDVVVGFLWTEKVFVALLGLGNFPIMVNGPNVFNFELISFVDALLVRLGDAATTQYMIFLEVFIILVLKSCCL